MLVALGAGMQLADAGAAGSEANLGERVRRVAAALDCPRCAGSMEHVVDLGTDSRYYIMVRGWLAEQLRADRALLDTAGEPAAANVRDRVEFIESAIRRIDLE